jgi:hypothetical protein
MISSEILGKLILLLSGARKGVWGCVCVHAHACMRAIVCAGQ